jgi:large repetitive protein
MPFASNYLVSQTINPNKRNMFNNYLNFFFPLKICIALLMLSLSQLAYSQNPQVFSINPNTVCEGETITINGLNFGTRGSNSRVTIGNANHTNFISWSNTSIRLVVSRNVTSSFYIGNVTVRNNAGQSGQGGIITVNNTPDAPSGINGINFVNCGGSTTLFLSGGWAGQTEWYANSCGSSVISTNPVALNVSPSVTTTYYVANVSGIGSGQCSSPCISFTVTNNCNNPGSTPVIGNLSPASGCPGDLIVITGQNFTGATSVVFNGIPAQFSVISATQINATVPPGATSGTISISNGSFTGVSPGSFIVNANCGTTCTVNVNPAAPSICAGQSVQLQASGASTYSWAPSTGLSSTNGALVSANPSVTTTYTVTGTNGSCTDQKTVTVVVNQTPQISVNPPALSLCIGDQANLTASGASSYSWSPSAGLNTTSGATVSVTGIDNTTYTVTGFNGTCSSSQSVNVTVQPKPVISVSPLIRGICAGNSLVLTASGANEYTWSPATGLNTTSGAVVTASPSETTTYAVSGTTNGCTATASVPVVVNPLPQVTASILPVGGSVCKGTSVTLSGGGATSYIWSGGISNNTPFIPSVSGTYTVTGTDDNGCSNTASINVSVNNIPATPGSISGPAALCDINTATFSVNPVQGATAYTWVLPSGLSGSSTTNSIQVSINQTLFTGGNISVSASNGSCSGASRTRALKKVFPAPSSISGPSIICGLSTATYTATAVSGANSYTWLLPSGLSGSSNTNTITVTINPAQFNGGSISVAAVNDCGTGSFRSRTLSIKPFTPGTITGPVSLCGLTSATYKVNQGTSVSSYTWSLPPGITGSSTTNTINVTVNPTEFQGGKITVIANNACGASQPKSLTLDQEPPIPGTISGPAVICGINSVTFSVNPVPGATSYTWTLPTGISGSSTSNSITAGVSSLLFTGGVVTVKANNTCGSSPVRSKNVTKTPLQPGNISGSTILCGVNSASYSVSAVAGATSYTWTLPEGLSGNSTSNVINVTVDPIAFNGGDIEVSANNACGSGAVRKLSVRAFVNVPGSITGLTNGVCSGSTQSYSCALVTGASSYDWTVPSGAQITSGQGTQNVTVVFPSPFAFGTISVAALNDCGRSNPRTITVRSVPAPPSSIAGRNSNLCGGGTFTFSVNPVAGASSYSWTIPNGCSIVGNATGNSISLNVPANFTSGQLSVRAQNTCGNSSASSVSLSALPATSGVIIGPSSVCANQQGVVFSTLPVNGVNSFQWSVPTGAQIIAGQGTASITVNWGNSSGNVSVFAKNNCGNGLSRSRNIAISCREAESEPVAVNAEELDVLIYPNPARERINIRLNGDVSTGGMAYRIFNTAGQLIAQDKISQSEFVLDRSAIQHSGIYFIQIIDQSGILISSKRISIVD